MWKYFLARTFTSSGYARSAEGCRPNYKARPLLRDVTARRSTMAWIADLEPEPVTAGLPQPVGGEDWPSRNATTWCLHRKQTKFSSRHLNFESRKLLWRILPGHGPEKHENRNPGHKLGP